MESAAGRQRHPDQYIVTVRIRLSRDHRLSVSRKCSNSGDGRVVRSDPRQRGTRLFPGAALRHARRRPPTMSGRILTLNFDPHEFSVVDRHNSSDMRNAHMSSRRSLLRLSRRATCCGSARRLSPAWLIGASAARGAVDRRLSLQGNFQPMPIAIPDFVGGSPATTKPRRRFADHHRQSQAQRPVRADRSGGIPRENRQRRRGAAVSRLAHHQRAGACHRAGHAAARRASQGRIPAVGRARRPAARRPAIFHDAGQLAPHRAHYLGRDLRAPDRRKRLFRQPRRVRRRDRTGGTPHQAACDHGSGRRQCALSHPWRRTGADAAFFAVDAGDHLHGLRPGRSARLSAQHRNRPARDCRQFSGHELSRRGFRRTVSAW